jgi:hypothetical protein
MTILTSRSTSDTTSVACNPVLDAYRKIRTDLGWWVDDTAEALTGVSDNGTGTFADILESIGAWDSDEDEPLDGHVLTVAQVGYLTHAHAVFVKLQAFRK